jgi:hypothetical protein
MHPKDERLTLLAYNVGRSQHLEEENRVLKKELEEALIRAERAENLAQSESRREQSIRDNYYALERKYDNLKKKTTKKKAVKK